MKRKRKKKVPLVWCKRCGIVMVADYKGVESQRCPVCQIDVRVGEMEVADD